MTEKRESQAARLVRQIREDERTKIMDAIAETRDKYRRNSGDWLSGFEDGCNEAIGVILARGEK